MSGIDTSQGINSVASQIATLEANQTQSVQTNTGATVTGLAAAAYEFGSILASYPADAPPLTQSAPVFQVTNADGSTSMVSLSDLANDIQKQTGFDPLLEFSAGIGFTNQGYSLSDINYVLNSLQTQFPGQMTFTQLAQVEGNQALAVNNKVDSQVQAAVSDLQSTLSNSQSYINQALAASPTGVSLDANIIFDPISATGAPDATALAQLPALSQTIANDQVAVAADQAAYNYAINNFSPADQAAIVAAQSQIAGSNPISGVNGIAPSASFLTALQAGLNQLTTTMGSSYTLQALSLNPSGNVFMSANNLLAGYPDANSSAGWSFSVTFFNDLSKNPQFDGYNETIAQYSSDSASAGYSWGSTGPDGKLYGIGATRQSSTSIIDLSNRGAVDPSKNSLTPYLTCGQPAVDGGNGTIFHGLMQSCGCDPGNPTQVAQFNAQLNKLIPGASSKPYFTAQDILNLQNLVNAFQTAQTHQTTAIIATYQRLQNDSNKLTADQSTLNNLMSSAMASTAPAAVPLQNLINSLTSANGTIAGYQSAIVSMQQQITTALNNQTLANTLESKLATTAAALAADPTNMIKQADHATALSAIQTFLGGTFATDADATAACEAYKTSQQGLISNPGGLQDQVKISQGTVNDYQTQLQSLQTQLLTLPNSSFKQLLADIQASTGIDMAAALKPVIGDGPLTLGNLNQVYQYINQQLPAGATQFPILTNDQLIQAASQQVLSFLNQPAFTQALASSPNGVDPSAAIFTVPGSNTPVSFNAALSLIAQGSGVNVTATINAILQGGRLTQQAVTGISAYLNNPPATAGAKPEMGVQLTDPTTGQQVSISGTQAAEFTFAQQLTRIDFNALAAAGSPISADAPIFISSDANGNPVDISLNQLMQNYANQGYNMAGLLPADTSTFTFANIGSMLDRLNADQTQAAFRIADNAPLNAGLQQVRALASSDSAASPDSVQNGLSLLTALGVPNPQKMYFQAVLASQLDGLDNTPGLGYIAANNGEFWSSDALSDAGQSIDSLQPLANQLGVTFNPIADDVYRTISQSGQATWEQELNATSLNALITQLNAANAGTPFSINNPYANTPGAQDTSRYGQIGFTSYVAPQADINFAANLNNNFTVFDMTKVPPLAMSNVNAPAEIADDLNNFNVDPKVQGALDFLRQALSQINSQDLDASGNLSMSNAVFNMPAIAQSLGEPASTPVSLSQIMTYATETTGANLSQAIPNLADANGNISFSNLNSLINILNQAVPSATANATACLNLANFLSPQAPPIQTQYGSIGLNFNQWSQDLHADLLGTAITGCTCETALYSDTLAGQLGIPQNRIAASATADVRTAAENSQLALITQKLSQLVPNFQAPATADGWTAATIVNLQAQLQAAAGPQPLSSLSSMLASNPLSANNLSVVKNQITTIENQISGTNTELALISNVMNAVNQPAISTTTVNILGANVITYDYSKANLATELAAGQSTLASAGGFVGYAPSVQQVPYSATLPGILGIPQATPTGPGSPAIYTANDLDAQYALVTQALAKLAPTFTPPNNSKDGWTSATLTSLASALQVQQASLQATTLPAQVGQLTPLLHCLSAQDQTSVLQFQLAALTTSPAGTLNTLSQAALTAIGQPVTGGFVLGNQTGANLPTLVGSGGTMVASMGVIGFATGSLLGYPTPSNGGYYSISLAKQLGIAEPTPTGANGRFSQADVNATYQLVTQKLALIAPSFTPPATADAWTAATLTALQTAIQAQQGTPPVIGFLITAINQPANGNNESPNLAQIISSSDGGNFAPSDMSDMASSGMFVGMSNSATSDLATYAASLPGLLGIPMPTPTGANGRFSQNDINANYQLVKQQLATLAPTFTAPTSAEGWTAATLSSLKNALQAPRSPQAPQVSNSPSVSQQINTLNSQIQTLQAHASLPTILSNVSKAANPTQTVFGVVLYDYANANLATELAAGQSTLASAGGFVGFAPSVQQVPYSATLPGILGIPQATPTGSGSPAIYTANDLDAQYSLVTQALAKLVPSFTPPASKDGWTTATLTSLQSALQSQQTTNNADMTALQQSFSASFVTSQNTLSQAWASASPSTFGNLTAVKTNLQNISFENVATAVKTGQASAAVTASFEQRIDQNAVPVLTAAEMDAQLQAGSLYVNKHGQFFLNRQPTNARDASVAAFVIGGNSLSSKLNNLMNDVNTRNTHVQILNYLSAATSASDLATRIQTEKAQYGYADILSEVTGGALTDAIKPGSDSDVLGTTGTFQSTLKTAINNATKNQDLDTQNLQSLTTQIQSNNTAMTQLLQAYEQLLKSVAQNFE